MANLTLPIPNELQNIMSEMWAEITAPHNPATGKAIEFSLAQGENKYLYYKGSRGEMFCYTPHPDTDGNFWCWTYQPRGKGARSGKPREWHLIDLVRCAKRKTAATRARARLQKAKTETQP